MKNKEITIVVEESSQNIAHQRTETENAMIELSNIDHNHTP